MRCPPSEFLLQYVDGELDEDQQAEIKSHISECEQCRGEYQSYHAMRELLTEHWNGKIQGCFDTEILAAYSEGQVSEDVTRGVEKHIQTCRVCASELRMMQQMDAVPMLEVPADLDDVILPALLRRRQLSGIAVFGEIKKNATEAARHLVKQFIQRYHESESTLVDTYWQMMSPLYSPEARFGSGSLGSAVSGMVGDAENPVTPSIIFACLGICHRLQESEDAPDERQLGQVVRQHARRFGLSRRDQRQLREFLSEQLSDN